MAQATNIMVKRIYAAKGPADGFRVLVDRLWPRGVRKEAVAIDLWAKQIAPSVELRQAFHSGALGWSDFQREYQAELARNPAFPDFAAEIRGQETVTLLFAAKDTVHTHALVLADVLRAAIGG